MHARLGLLALPFALGLLAPTAHADLIVVPPTADVFDNEIAAALARAQPGDTVQLLAGDYVLEDVGAKLLIEESVRLIGAGPQATRIIFSNSLGSLLVPNLVEVAGVPADGRVLIQGIGFEITSQPATPGALLVRDCEGPVTLLDVELFNATPELFSGAGLGAVLRAERCAALQLQSVTSPNPGGWEFEDCFAVLESCSLIGLAGLDVINFGGPGLRADRCALSISGTTVAGGEGGTFGQVTMVDAPGLPALALQASAATLFGGTDLTGGAAGEVFGSGARGGPAVSVDAFSRLRLDPGASLAGGVGATGLAPELKVDPGGQVFADDRRRMRLSASDPVLEEGEQFEFELTGEPGAVAVFYVAFAPLQAPVFLPSIGGGIALDLQLAVEFFTGLTLALDSAGSLSLPISVLAKPVDGALESSWQAAELLPNGTFRTTNPLVTLVRTAE